MERPALDTVGTIVDGIKSVTDNLGPIISTAFSLISKIVEIAQTVKANRKKCATMAERVSGLKAPLQTLLQNPKQDSTILVTRLNKALHATLELIQAYNDKHFIVRVLTSKSAKEDFEQATLEITRCVTDLTLEVTISLKDIKRDTLDDEEDRRELVDVLAKLSEQIMHTRDEIIDSLSARLESLEASSQAYQAEARETHGKLLDGQGRLESGQERILARLEELTEKQRQEITQLMSKVGANMASDDKLEELENWHKDMNELQANVARINARVHANVEECHLQELLQPIMAEIEMHQSTIDQATGILAKRKSRAFEEALEEGKKDLAKAQEKLEKELDGKPSPRTWKVLKEEERTLQKELTVAKEAYAERLRQKPDVPFPKDLMAQLSARFSEVGLKLDTVLSGQKDIREKQDGFADEIAEIVEFSEARQTKEFKKLLSIVGKKTEKE